MMPVSKEMLKAVTGLMGDTMAQLSSTADGRTNESGREVLVTCTWKCEYGHGNRCRSSGRTVA